MSKKLHQILKIHPEDNVTPLYPSFGSASNNFGKIPEDAHVQIVNCNIDPSKPRGQFEQITFRDPPVLLEPSDENQDIGQQEFSQQTTNSTINGMNSIDGGDNTTNNENGLSNTPSVQQTSNKYTHHPLSTVLVPLQRLIDDMHIHEPLCLDKAFWKDYSNEIRPILESAIKSGRQLDRGSPKLKNWGDTELKLVLDGLSQFLSYASISAVQGEQEGEALKKDIVERLYNQIGVGAKGLGIYEVQRIIPIDDTYDFYKPNHQMVEGMEVNDVLVGRILEIRSAGILNIKDGSIDQEAQVVVGVKADSGS